MGRRGRTGAALGVLLLTGAAAVGGLYLWREAHPPHVPTGECTAARGETTSTLDAAQAGNAAIIAAVSARMGLPAHAATVGIATAMQESSLYNLDWGDRDSLGLFQQRPSQGWGSEEEVQDPYYAAETFYAALVRVDGWESLDVTVAAQRVQRSAFPDAYATREAPARVWAAALRGQSGPIAVRCDVVPGPGTTAQDVAARIALDWGDAYRVGILDATSEAVWLDVVPAADDAGAADAFAAWAVAVAAQESLGSVVNGAESWDVGYGVADVEPPRAPSGVAVRLIPVDLDAG